MSEGAGNTAVPSSADDLTSAQPTDTPTSSPSTPPTDSPLLGQTAMSSVQPEATDAALPESNTVSSAAAPSGSTISVPPSVEDNSPSTQAAHTSDSEMLRPGATDALEGSGTVTGAVPHSEAGGALPTTNEGEPVATAKTAQISGNEVLHPDATDVLQGSGTVTGAAPQSEVTGEGEPVAATEATVTTSGYMAAFRPPAEDAEESEDAKKDSTGSASPKRRPVVTVKVMNSMGGYTAPFQTTGLNEVETVESEEESEDEGSTTWNYKTRRNWFLGQELWTPAMERKYELLRKYVKRQIANYPNGIRAEQFSTLSGFTMTEAEKHIRRLGFHRLQDMFATMPDIIKARRSTQGKIFFPVPEDEVPFRIPKYRLIPEVTSFEVPNWAVIKAGRMPGNRAFRRYCIAEEYLKIRTRAARVIQRYPQGCELNDFIYFCGMETPPGRPGRKIRRKWMECGNRSAARVLSTMTDLITIVPKPAYKPPWRGMVYPARPKQPGEEDDEPADEEDGVVDDTEEIALLEGDTEVVEGSGPPIPGPNEAKPIGPDVLIEEVPPVGQPTVYQDTEGYQLPGQDMYDAPIAPPSVGDVQAAWYGAFSSASPDERWQRWYQEMAAYQAAMYGTSTEPPQQQQQWDSGPSAEVSSETGEQWSPKPVWTGTEQYGYSSDPVVPPESSQWNTGAGWTPSGGVDQQPTDWEATQQTGRPSEQPVPESVWQPDNAAASPVPPTATPTASMATSFSPQVADEQVLQVPPEGQQRRQKKKQRGAGDWTDSDQAWPEADGTARGDWQADSQQQMSSKAEEAPVDGQWDDAGEWGIGQEVKTTPKRSKKSKKQKEASQWEANDWGDDSRWKDDGQWGTDGEWANVGWSESGEQWNEPSSDLTSKKKKKRQGTGSKVAAAVVAEDDWMTESGQDNDWGWNEPSSIPKRKRKGAAGSMTMVSVVAEHVDAWPGDVTSKPSDVLTCNATGHGSHGPQGTEGTLAVMCPCTCHIKVHPNKGAPQSRSLVAQPITSMAMAPTQATVTSCIIS